MKFNKLVRQDTEIQTIYDKQNADGHLERFDITAHEAPEPVMDTALEALAPVCQSIRELASVNSIQPYGVTVSYTKHGTRSCSILFRRKLDATGQTYKEKTPSFQIDDPAEGEDDERECSADQAALVEVVIECGIAYANGTRSQKLLPLDAPDPTSEPAGGDSNDQMNLDDDSED